MDGSVNYPFGLETRGKVLVPQYRCSNSRKRSFDGGPKAVSYLWNPIDANCEPDCMTQLAWDYLLRFTIAHEAMFSHMYNNRASETANQDVTCGIGVLFAQS